MSLLIKNAHIISPDVDERGAVLVENGKIAKVFKAGDSLPAADETYDAAGKMVVPGFIDTHIHGGMGYEATCGKPEAICAIAEGKMKEGVTSFCPTTLTLSKEALIDSLKLVEAYRKDAKFTKVLGVHLEGPFLNRECLGAQNPAFIRRPDIAEVKELSAISHVSIVTYALDVDGCIPFTRDLVNAGIKPSCGHTNATYEQFKAGQKEGLARLTHFCNQMTKLHHREIGLVGAGLYDDTVAIEMICDKIHLCPDMLRLIFTRRSLAHVQMITDSLRCSHCKDGYAFEMGGLKVLLKGGEARLVEGNNLAGSTLWMGMGLKNVHDVTGIPLKDLVRTTSWNQAIELGWGRTLGKVEKGYTADLVVINPRSWKPSAVFVDGEQRI